MAVKYMWSRLEARRWGSGFICEEIGKEEMHTDYLMSQENKTRVDVRWMALRDKFQIHK